MNIEFSLSLLDGYAIIDKPCTAIVKVASNPGKLYKEDGHNRWILNLRAVTRDNLDILVKIEDSPIEYTFKSISHLLLTGALWENQIVDMVDLPTKGENVIATFDFVGKVLRCTNITTIPRYTPKTFRASSAVKKAIDEFSELIKDIKYD